MKMAIFLGRRAEKKCLFLFQILDAGGFAKQGIKKYSPDGIERSGCTL
jgi:hypothetical protein